MTCKTILLCGLFLLLPLTGGTASAQWLHDLPETRPDPTNILRAVRRNFPDRPLQVDGELIAKNKRGDIQLTRRIAFTLDLSAPTGTARYVLSDAFGEEIERLVITRPPDSPPRYTHYAGPHAEPAPLAEAAAPLEGLDFTWTDLAMNFLWWPDVAIAGKETKLNRPCTLLDVKPDPNAAEPYARVRLWVDEQSAALLEAQGFDAEDRLLKKLQIQTLKKVDALWTVGDIEVHTYPARTKTRLRIRDVRIDHE